LGGARPDEKRWDEIKLAINGVTENMDVTGFD
jgi:hypothetical protein